MSEGLTDERSLHVGVIDVGHARIHRGELFSVAAFVEDVVDDATLDLLIRVGAAGSQPAPHCTFGAAANGEAVVRLYEAPTNSALGSPLTPRNHNRLSSNVPSTLVYSGPTITGVGTLIGGPILLPGADKQNLAGGTLNDFAAEFILNFGTDYLLRVQNISGSANDLGLTTVFYETTVGT